MSVDYRVKVYRKEDGKHISEFLCNYFKSIFDCGVSEYEDFKNFDMNSLLKCKENIKSEIKNCEDQISKFENMIPKCESVEVKHEIEEDIQSKKDYLDDLNNALESCIMIIGMLYVVVEDNIKITTNEDDYSDNNMAYAYNAEGLSKTKDGYDKYLWVDGVKCELIADY